MSTLLYILRTVFISLEFLIIVTAVVLLSVFPNLIQALSSALKESNEVAKYTAFMPTLFFVWVFKESRKLLFPSENTKKSMQAWEGYGKLKIHFYVALFYSLVFCVVGLLSWFVGININQARGFVIVFFSIVGGGVTVASVFLARISIDEILVDLK